MNQTNSGAICYTAHFYKKHVYPSSKMTATVFPLSSTSSIFLFHSSKIDSTHSFRDMWQTLKLLSSKASHYYKAQLEISTSQLSMCAWSKKNPMIRAVLREHVSTESVSYRNSAAAFSRCSAEPPCLHSQASEAECWAHAHTHWLCGCEAPAGYQGVWWLPTALWVRAGPTEEALLSRLK